MSLLLYLQNGDDVFLFHLEDFLARLVKTMFKEVFICKIVLSDTQSDPKMKFMIKFPKSKGPISITAMSLEHVTHPKEHLLSEQRDE